MITLLYRKIFAITLKKQLARNFAYFCAGRSMTPEQRAMVINKNTSFYTSKMMDELSLAFNDLKRRIPWLDLASWTYLVSALACIGALAVTTQSNLTIIIALVSGTIGFGIVMLLLLRSTGMFNETLDEDAIRTLASSISIQIPLCLIQILLGVSLAIVGSLTHNISTIISGMAIMAMIAVTQYTTMSNFLRMFETRTLNYDETKEFLKATLGLYNRDAKAWLPEESMEGGKINIDCLQRLQGFEAVTESSDEDS